MVPLSDSQCPDVLQTGSVVVTAGTVTAGETTTSRNSPCAATAGAVSTHRVFPNATDCQLPCASWPAIAGATSTKRCSVTAGIQMRSYLPGIVSSTAAYTAVSTHRVFPSATCCQLPCAICPAIAGATST